jgi:hypothetical protein
LVGVGNSLRILYDIQRQMGDDAWNMNCFFVYLFLGVAWVVASKLMKILLISPIKYRHDRLDFSGFGQNSVRSIVVLCLGTHFVKRAVRLRCNRSARTAPEPDFAPLSHCQSEPEARYL